MPLSPRSLLSLILLFLLTACAPKSQPGWSPVDRAEGQSLLKKWSALSEEVSSVQGMARAKVSSPQQSGGGTQVVLAELPDHFRAETLSPFGTPLLLLAANGSELGVLMPTQNLFYAGQASPENLARFTRMPLKPEDLVKLLLYRPPLITEKVAATYQLSEGGWLVELRNPARSQQLWFNAERQLTGVEYFDRDQLFLKVSYRRIGEQVSGFPAEYEIELPEFETTAFLRFNEQAVNREFLPGIFRLKAPAGARVVDLDSQIK